MHNIFLTDALVSIVWCISTYALIRASITLSLKAFPADSRAQHLLHSGVITVALYLFGATMLGTLGLLTGASLLLMALALSALSTLFCISPSHANADRDHLHWTSRIWLPVIGILTGHVILGGLTHFPTDYDCLMYHIPLIDQWIQAGSLAATDIARWPDPANNELLGLWLTAPFSGDFLVRLNNIPSIIVWAAAAIEVGRLIGLTVPFRQAAAVAALTGRAIIKQCDSASNDLMVVGFFLAGLAYSLRYSRSRSTNDLLLAGVSLGIVGGTKFYALGYAALLFWIFIVSSRLTASWRHTLLASPLLLAASAPFATYWLIRNTCVTGYPLFPQGSNALHERIVHPNLFATTLALNGDPSIFATAMDVVWKSCGPLHFWSTLLTPLLCVGIAISYRSSASPRRPTIQARLVLALALTGALLITLFTPMLVENLPGTLNQLERGDTLLRYGLCFLSLAMLAFFVPLQACTTSARGFPLAICHTLIAFVTVAQFILCFVWRSAGGAMMDLFFGASLVFSLESVRYCFRYAPLWRETAAAIALSGSAFSVFSLSLQWHERYSEHFNSHYFTQLFDSLGETNGANIVVLYDRPYAFYGQRRQNHIIQPLKYHALDELKDLMLSRGAPLVVAEVRCKPHSRYFHAWLDIIADPEFELVHIAHDFRIFRLRRGAS